MMLSVILLSMLMILLFNLNVFADDTTLVCPWQQLELASELESDI